MVRTVLLYGVFGPPIGAFPIILGSISSYGATDSVTETLLMAWPWIYFSYFSGLVPALITGYFVEHLPRRWPAVGFVSCAGLIGSLVTFGWAGRLMSSPDQELVLLSLLGGFSAGTLALALRFIPRLHPKPSA
ncbi:MAG: hypothetical protein ACH37Z_16415 [Anaerolineae bacterium]